MRTRASAEGGRQEASCIWATSTRTFTNTAPANPPSACSGCVAITAEDELHFRSGMCDIALQYIGGLLSLCYRPSSLRVPRKRRTPL